MLDAKLGCVGGQNHHSYATTCDANGIGEYEYRRQQRSLISTLILAHLPYTVSQFPDLPPLLPTQAPGNRAVIEETATCSRGRSSQDRCNHVNGPIRKEARFSSLSLPDLRRPYPCPCCGILGLPAPPNGLLRLPPNQPPSSRARRESNHYQPSRSVLHPGPPSPEPWRSTLRRRHPRLSRGQRSTPTFATHTPQRSPTPKYRVPWTSSKPIEGSGRSSMSATSMPLAAIWAEGDGTRPLEGSG